MATKAQELLALGIRYQTDGNMVDAATHYRASLDAANDADDSDGAGQAMACIANIIFVTSYSPERIEVAITWYDSALSYLRDSGNKMGEAAVLNNIGGAYQLLDNIELSIKFYLESLTIREEIDDLPGQAKVLNNLGVLAAMQEKLAEAESYYLRALAIYQKIEKPRLTADVMCNMAALQIMLGNEEGAVRIHQMAKELLTTSKETN